jgi:putative autotransporter adhesin-like protein
MRTSSAAFLAAAALLAASAALGQPVERAQDLQPFDKLELHGCFNSRLEPGRPERITINATPEQHERIRVRQEGGIVSVEPIEWRNNDWGSFCRDGRIEVRITADFAKDDSVTLGVHGSGDLDAEVPAVARLTVRVAGSGDLSLRGAANDCDLSVSGSGDAVARGLACAATTEVSVHGSGSVTLEGKTESCEFEVHGSGDVIADDYACESAEASIYGSGSVDLAEVANLEVEIHGSGDVSHRGQPALRGVEIHGSGKVNRL